VRRLGTTRPILPQPRLGRGICDPQTLDTCRFTAGIAAAPEPQGRLACAVDRRGRFCYPYPVLGLRKHSRSRPPQIGEHLFVDGGVADNTPVLPVTQHGLDELWIIRLRPEKIDLDEHLNSILSQQFIATGAPAPPDFFSSIIHKLRVVQITPQTDLGGMLTGTLNFRQRRTGALLRHGYRVASRVMTSPDEVLKMYRPRFALKKRIRFILRAMPGCSLRRFLKRGSADTSEPYRGLREYPLRLPNPVRAARHGHMKAVSAASRYSVITKNATTKARTTCCSPPPLLGLSPVGDVASAVENVLAAYSGTTAAPHEYFDHTTSNDRAFCVNVP